MFNRFHYDYFMRKYPAAKLLFMDTDSLMYWIETEDIYKEMARNISTLRHMIGRVHFMITQITR